MSSAEALMSNYSSATVPAATPKPAPAGRTELVLTPPDSATFFHHTEFDGPTLESPDEYSITWRIEQFSYAINSTFPPSHPSFNGSIYVILLHHISANYGGKGLLTPTITFGIQLDTSKSIIPDRHLPESGTGVKSGDDYTYHMQFKEDFQMLINQSQDWMTFKAIYDDSFVSFKHPVMGIIDASKGMIGFTVDASSGTQIYRGFTLLKTRDMKQWPADLRFIAMAMQNRSPYMLMKERNVKIELGFNNDGNTA